MEGEPTGAEADVEAVPKETIATGERCEKIECATTTPGGADIDEPAAFGDVTVDGNEANATEQSSVTNAVVLASKNELSKAAEAAKSAVIADDGANGTPDRRRFGVRWFVVNLSILYFYQSGMRIYLFGVIRTMERRFGFHSKKSGFILSANNIVKISVVTFIGYFGRRGHKPRIISCLLLAFVFGGFLLASPHFLFTDEPASFDLAGNVTIAAAPLCVAGGGGMAGCEAGDAASLTTSNDVAYALFVVGQMFVGLGYSATAVLGLSYIDENSPKDKSALYMGLFAGFTSLGSVFGNLLAAASTRLPENLGDTSKSPTDPTWIGCWWLGFIICPIHVIIVGIPMFFFPKRLAPERLPNRAETTKRTETHNNSLMAQFKEIPSSFRSLLTNPAYLVREAADVLFVYFFVAIFVNVPRFLETHFQLPAALANMYAAFPSVTSVAGSVAGGALMSRLRLTPVGAAKLLVGVALTVCVGVAAILLMDCPQVNMAGRWLDSGRSSLSVDTSCSMNCSCVTTTERFSLVCGLDRRTYFSACHAGCLRVGNGSAFEECGCLSSGDRVEAGFCTKTCDLLVVFLAVLLLVTLVGSLSKVPSTIILFRTVKEDERAFGLAFHSFCINLIGYIPAPVLFGGLIDSTCLLWDVPSPPLLPSSGYIPAPVLFGGLIDSTCLLWDEPCGQRGACLLYDTTAFRYVTYGVGLGFLVVVAVLKCLLWYLVARIDFDAPEAIELAVAPGGGGEKQTRTDDSK